MLSNYIYENTKNEFIKDFDNIREQEEILYFYKKYLDNQYSSTIKNAYEFEKLKDRFLKLEKSKWSISKNVKQSLLIEDESLKKLGYLSDLGLKYAIAKLKNEDIGILTEESINKYISDMNTLVDKVRDFNSDLAKTYLSEGILDFMYAGNLTDNTSLRLSRMK